MNREPDNLNSYNPRTLTKRCKGLIWDLTYLSGLLSFLRRIKVHREYKGIIFYYHRVNPNPLWDPVLVHTGTSLFRKQLRLLKKSFNFVRLTEFFESLQKGNGPSKGYVQAVITFDDGYQDVLDHAWPILKDLNIYPALFVCTDPILRRMPLPWDVLSQAVQSEPRIEIQMGPPSFRRKGYTLRTWEGKEQFVREVNQDLLAGGRELQKKAYLDLYGERLKEIKTRLNEWYIRPERLRECLEEGIEIGSHTASHPYLPNLQPAEWDQEIRGSKSELESFLGQEVPFFSYPAGRVNGLVREYVKESGYRGALATGNKVVSLKNQDPFSLPRIGPGDMVAMGEFYGKVSGLHPHWFR